MGCPRVTRMRTQDRFTRAQARRAVALPFEARYACVGPFAFSGVVYRRCFGTRLRPRPCRTSPRASAAPKVKAHCEAHGKPYTRHEKSGKVWYSHKAPDGSWCNEDNGRKAAA